MLDLFGWTVLITGGTGCLGRVLTRWLLTMPGAPKRVIVFADSEGSHSAMRAADSVFHDPRLEYFLGNVRSLARLEWAFGAKPDLVIHAAALKEVPSCEYNPSEAVETNVVGSQNVVDAAVQRDVPRVILISTDKAAGATTPYGATKAAAEAIFVQGNTRAGGARTRFSVARYGNCWGTRESVINRWQEQAEAGGPLTVTDPAATRFWWTLDEAVPFILRCALRSHGGEVWTPKMGSESLTATAARVGPGVPQTTVGYRSREKQHEVLVTADEGRHTVEVEDAYVILPLNPTWPFRAPLGSVPVAEGFSYSSDQRRWPVRLVGVEEEVTA